MGIISSIQDKLKGSKPSSALSTETILSALSKVQDPDLNQDIVSLGFVQNLKINDGKISFEVNLTTPACPVKDKLKAECEEIVQALPGVTEVKVTMTAHTRASTRSANDSTHASLAGVKNIIAIASGKGGVGKSTTSVNIAYALAECGSKVGLLDADIYGPSIPLMTSAHHGKPSAQQSDLVEPLLAHGVKVISIGLFNPGSKASILRGPMAASVIKQFMTQVNWGELDYLIIDYPPGTGDIQLTISQTAPLTGAVVVTTPQEVALIDVRKAVNMFETLKVPVLGVVETMSYFICDGCDKKHFIFREGGGKKVARDYGAAFLGGIPMEASVADASDKGTPLVLSKSEGASVNAYRDAAKNLAAQISIQNANNVGALKQFSLAWKL